MRGTRCYTNFMKFFPDDNGGLIPFETQRRYLPLPKQRIWELDFLRAVCVFLMVLDHLSMMIDMFAPSWYGRITWYDLGMGNAITRFCHEWVGSENWRVAHCIVLIVFMGISGMSCTFSRSNRKRGALLMAVSCAYSLVTFFDEYVLGITGSFVTFGVTHFLATAILLYALVDFFCKRDKRSVAICSVGIMGISLLLYFCYTPPANTPKIFFFLFPPRNYLGEPSLFYSQSEMSPGDLFTVFQYLPYFFWGAAVAPFIYNDRRSLLPKLDGKWNKPFCFIGRHALIVFILHLPIMLGLLSLISYIFITPGSWGF